MFLYKFIQLIKAFYFSETKVTYAIIPKLNKNIGSTIGLFHGTVYPDSYSLLMNTETELMEDGNVKYILTFGIDNLVDFRRVCFKYKINHYEVNM